MLVFETGYQRPIDSLAISHDSRYLAVMDRFEEQKGSRALRSIIRIWYLDRPSYRTNAIDRYRASNLKFTPDDRYLAYVSGGLHFLSASKYRRQKFEVFSLHEILEYYFLPEDCAFVACPNGMNTLDFGPQQSKIKLKDYFPRDAPSFFGDINAKVVMDASLQRIMTVIEVPTGPLAGLPIYSRLAPKNYRVKLWSYPIGKLLHTKLIPHSEKTPNSTKYLLMKDSNRFISKSEARVEILGLNDDTPPYPLTITSDAFDIALTPNERWLAVGYNDGVVRLFDTQQWQPGPTFDWQIGPIEKITFSVDGTIAAAASRTKVVVWDCDY
jgi:WD40 repeat protein